MFHAMDWQGVVPNILSYNVLIIACEKGKKPEQAVEVFHAMQRQGMFPDIITCSTISNAREKGKQSK